MSTRLSTLVGSVVQAALTPHPVDRYLELVDPMITWRDLRAEVDVADQRPRSIAGRRPVVDHQIAE